MAHAVTKAAPDYPGILAAARRIAERGDTTMSGREAVEEMDVSVCNRCGNGPLTKSGTYRDAHVPCCSSHRKILCCACYRTTHFVEVGPCH